MNPRFGRFISIIHRLSHSYICAKMGPGKIGCGEIGVLMTLKRMSMPSQEEVREILEIDKGALARTIASMEKKGFLKRSKDKEDRRIRRLRLTEEGSAVADSVREAMGKWQLSITEGIDEDELDTTVRTLKKMAENAVMLRDQKKDKK